MALNFDVRDVRVTAVDEANRHACLVLDVSLEQRDFVPDVASSLAMAAQYEHARPLAVLWGDVVVGFALYGIDYQTGLWKIFRLLIAESMQGEGVGRGAMLAMIARLRDLHGAGEVLLVYHVENLAAQRLYASLGFVVYEERDHLRLARLVIDGGGEYDD